MTSTMTFFVRCVNEEDASLLSASARLFVKRWTCMTEKLSKLSCRHRTLVKYRFINSSLALYVPFTWFVMSSESLNTCRRRTSILTISFKPVIKTSYSASLLDARNSKRKAYIISFLFGSVIIRPAPEPSLLDAPSIVSLTTVGDLEVLMKDIDVGIHEEVLSGMSNDKRKVVIEALGAMCELIETRRASNLPNDGLLYSIDDVVALFGAPLNSPKEFDEFTKDLEVCKYALWSKLTKDTRSGIIDIICNRWQTLLNMQKSAL
ncbi:hypothetical protein Tco_1124735, partial [Tanacetum coccineum]